MKYTYFGDANLDGVVTTDDLTLWIDGFNGGGTTWLSGDWDYSGAVTTDDPTLWIDSFNGQTGPLSGVGGVAPVPEPSTVALLVCGTLAVLAYRRRRKRNCIPLAPREVTL